MNVKFKNYKQIQSLKNGPIVVDEIDYAKVISTKLYSQNFRYRLKTVIYSLFFDLNIQWEDFIPSSKDIFIVYGDYVNRRSDCLEIVGKIKKIISEKSNYCEVVLSDSFSFKGPRFYFDFFKLILKLKNCKYPKFFKFITSLMAAKYIRDRRIINRKFKNILKDSSCLISFCDSISYENLFIQNFQTMFPDGNTYTLQHGQYRYLNENNICQDAEAYGNFISNYMLCWGQATIAEFQKADISKNRFISVGCLRDFSSLKSLREGLSKSTHRAEKIFGVVLCGENQKETNVNLIDFAKKLSLLIGYKYRVRAHPSNKINYIKMLSCENCIEVKNYTSDLYEYYNGLEFSILHMSGVLLEFFELEHSFVFYDDGLLADVYKYCGNFTSSPSDVLQIVYKKLDSEKLKKYFNDNGSQDDIIRRVFDVYDI